MSPQESCSAVEAKIQEIQQLLLAPSVETLERCEMELARVASLLEGLISGGSKEWTPAVAASLRSIQQAARRWQAQIVHASNLWQGWLQLKLGTGYTGEGLPVFAECEPGSSFEV
jgi:hypothetical protein